MLEETNPPTTTNSTATTETKEEEDYSFTTTPNRPISLLRNGEGEVLKLGHITCRILEDGSKTDNRLALAHFTLPPHTSGPPAHWHEMHDETFHVLSGTVTFHTPAGPHVAHAGDFITVPIRAPHTFSNEGDDEASFINTFSPAFYVGYFRGLAGESVGDAVMRAEKNEKGMRRFGTVAL